MRVPPLRWGPQLLLPRHMFFRALGFSKPELSMLFLLPPQPSSDEAATLFLISEIPFPLITLLDGSLPRCSSWVEALIKPRSRPRGERNGDTLVAPQYFTSSLPSSSAALHFPGFPRGRLTSVLPRFSNRFRSRRRTELNQNTTITPERSF